MDIGRCGMIYNFTEHVLFIRALQGENFGNLRGATNRPRHPEDHTPAGGKRKAHKSKFKLKTMTFLKSLIIFSNIIFPLFVV